MKTPSRTVTLLTLGLGCFGAGAAFGLAQPNAGVAQAQTAPVTPKTQAPNEARAMSRAFAATAKALGPSVVRIDVETGPPKVARNGQGQGRGGGGRNIPPELAPFFERFFGFGDGDEGFPEPGPGKGTGSGLIMDAAGNIMTNTHVVKGATKVTVILSDGRELPARVIGMDPETDVAVVRLEKPPTGLVAARLGDSDKLEVGEWVMAVGSPLGLAQTVTAGIVSGKGKASGRMRMVSGNRVRQYIQTDAKINPGNSGGPLVNLDSEVVGINTFINTGPGGAYGFAIPINEARTVAQALIKDGRMRYAYMGVNVGDLELVKPEVKQKLRNVPDRAAIVAAVTAGSPAEKAGLRPNDVITKIDAQNIQGASDVVGYISSRPIGSKVSVQYVRDGKPTDAQVTLAELPGEEVAQASQDRIGLGLQTLSPEIARALGLPPDTKGAVITEVVPGSRADKAGLEDGDVILKVNRKDVRSADDAVAALRAQPGEVLLQVRRGNATRFVTVPAN